MSGEPGTILVRNGGGYVARCYVKYTKSDGKRESHDSGDITVGVNKSFELPVGSTHIEVKAEEMWGFGWSTIFTKHYSHVVCKEYELLGTTLDPHYHEKDISC